MNLRTPESINDATEFVCFQIAHLNPSFESCINNSVSVGTAETSVPDPELCTIVATRHIAGMQHLEPHLLAGACSQLL